MVAMPNDKLTGSPLTSTDSNSIEPLHGNSAAGVTASTVGAFGDPPVEPDHEDSHRASEVVDLRFSKVELGIGFRPSGHLVSTAPASFD